MELAVNYCEIILQLLILFHEIYIKRKYSVGK